MSLLDVSTPGSDFTTRFLLKEQNSGLRFMISLTYECILPMSQLLTATRRCDFNELWSTQRQGKFIKELSQLPTSNGRNLRDVEH